MKAMLRGVVLALALGQPVLPALADPADPGHLADTLSVWLGAPLSTADRRAVIGELQAGFAKAPENNAILAPALVSLATLGANAAHPAARGVMRDLYRQILGDMIADPATPRAVALMEAADPFVRADTPDRGLGLGLADSDIAAAAWLENAAQAMPDRAEDAVPSPDFAARSRAALIALYDDSNLVNRQFLSRLNAWAAGVRAAWPDLTIQQRRQAASVTIADDMPTPDVLERVTGSRDLQFWLAAGEPGLTGPEAAAHPELAALLGKGVLAGPVMEVLALRMATIGAMAAQTNTLNMMRQLNHELLMSDPSETPGIGRILGLE